MKYYSAPFPHIIIDNFLPIHLHTSISDLHVSLPFTLKHTDLFHFHQSYELSSDVNTLSSFMDNLKQLASKLKIPEKYNLKIDCFASVYYKGDFLLCHDDVIDSRKYAYSYYISSCDDGALVFYDNTASIIVKKVDVVANRLVVFEVSDVSFHEVEMCNGERRALTGWLSFDDGFNEKKNLLEMMYKHKNVFVNGGNENVCNDECSNKDKCEVNESEKNNVEDEPNYNKFSKLKKICSINQDNIENINKDQNIDVTEYNDLGSNLRNKSSGMLSNKFFETPIKLKQNFENYKESENDIIYLYDNIKDEQFNVINTIKYRISDNVISKEGPFIYRRVGKVEPSKFIFKFENKEIDFNLKLLHKFSLKMESGDYILLNDGINYISGDVYDLFYFIKCSDEDSVKYVDDDGNIFFDLYGLENVGYLIKRLNMKIFVERMKKDILFEHFVYIRN